MSEEKPLESMERPREVECAVQMAFVSLVLALIAIPFRPAFVKPEMLGFMILGIIITVLFTSFLLIMILRGQNWARLLFIILFFIGLPFTFLGIILTLQKSQVSMLISLIQLSLQIMATVLLVQRPTRNWFKSVKMRKLMNYQVT